jgi:hypothetical protein
MSKVSPMAFIASGNLEEGIIQEQVEMEVLMPKIFIPFEFRAAKKLPAMPGRSRKWGPKMETTAISESILKSGLPIWGLISFKTTKASSSWARDTQKMT